MNAIAPYIYLKDICQIWKLGMADIAAVLYTQFFQARRKFLSARETNMYIDNVLK